MSRPLPLKIGLSARISHPEARGVGLRSKTLQVLEQSIAHWVASRDALVLMVPSVLQGGDLPRSSLRVSDYAAALDALLLQGGADVSPRAYGEEPLRPDWCGDPVRDAYELELIEAFMAAGKPILGICRGMQLINVALGGSLYQDLPTLRPGAVAHETADYDHNIHTVRFTAEGRMGRWFAPVESGLVASIHHQGVHRLGRDVVVEATAEDGLIEAISWAGPSFVCGVQWHPEFHHLRGAQMLDCNPLLDAFLDAARRARG